MEGEASAGYLWRVYIHVRRRLETSGLVYGRLWSKGYGGEIGPLLKTGREDDQADNGASAPGQGLWTHLQITMFTTAHHYAFAPTKHCSTNRDESTAARAEFSE
jgi:hypothetical protein